MNQELIFETREGHTVVRADSMHAALGVVTDLRTWVIMHTAAGNAEFGVDIFHTDSPMTACWSLQYASEVAMLERAPEMAEWLMPSVEGIRA
ncbi:phage anti-repressor protein [Deinococcus metalli]|uniref:Phage anti-repressor protein n=1 Tax=Deinococcus metalli TaxID=1141878 RepID=A0A7W8NSL5_9DEIO|nr:hypothetical protein [Deinococcus metalli]MBB5379070.1 phage anti-repressor protein [Deinococcus metalli]GHF64015.1 hypothetical protein GCM10017781_44950 [Deinococcus metalli]